MSINKLAHLNICALRKAGERITWKHYQIIIDFQRGDLLYSFWLKIVS